MARTPQLQSFLNEVFPEETARVSAGKCPFCAKEINKSDFVDALSLKEFEISGMCQKCQDEFFK